MRTGVCVEDLDVRAAALDGGAAANARTRWSERRGLLLRLRARGLVGAGEASPLPEYSPDDFENAKAALEGVRVADLQLEPENALASAAGLARAVLPGSVPSARFALETALLDLAGQLAGCPMDALLGAGEDGESFVAEVLTNPATALDDALRAEARGVRALKLKVGRAGAWAEELRLVHALRSRWPELGLRLDANQAFRSSSSERFADLEDTGIEFLEEPAPLETWPSSPSRLRLAADESLRRPGASAQLERWAPRLGAVILKPAVLGGLSAALEWSVWARRRGIASVVSHIFDGPVAASALRSLIRALPTGGPAHGLGLHRAGGPIIRPSTRSGLDLAPAERAL